MTTSFHNGKQAGFKGGRGGAHASRTIMLDELRHLISCVDRSGVTVTDYRAAIVDDNCLSKRSAKTRELTYRHLNDLYALNPSIMLFRGLLYFWSRDEVAQPLLALLCAYCRDPLLRSSASLVLGAPEGAIISREAVEGHIEQLNPGRFSPATLKSTAQNINSSWTKAGHLTGRARKIRHRLVPSPGGAAYAVFLGHLSGIRGMALFDSEYSKLLDCPAERVLDLVQDAAARGWLTMNRIGDVVEVNFPQLLRGSNGGVDE
jgi:hypothetical protein